MKKLIYLFATLTLFFVACNNNKEPQNTNKMHSEKMRMNKEANHDHSSHDHSANDREKSHIATTNQKSNLTSGIIDGYLQLKNALVEDNSKKAAVSGKMILDAFSNFEMSKLTSDQHKEYMDIAEDAKEQVEHIIKNPIAHQREHFEVLSNDIYDLIKLIGTNKHLYLDNCKMYDNGKGAIWLSETQQIKNPYFGSKDLSCGNIQKEIK